MRSTFEKIFFINTPTYYVEKPKQSFTCNKKKKKREREKDGKAKVHEVGVEISSLPPTNRHITVIDRQSTLGDQ